MFDLWEKISVVYDIVINIEYNFPSEMGSRVNKYKVENVDNGTLLYQKDPQWFLPSVYFAIEFTTHKKNISRFGQNSLHYLEHVLYNFILEDNGAYIDQGNAYTVSDGKMGFYFISGESKKEKAIEGIFKTFIKLLTAPWPKTSKIYKTEQGRVSSETYEVLYDYDFMPNSDFFAGTYDNECLRALFLNYCRMEGLTIFCHCNVVDKKAFTSMVSNWAKKLHTAWKEKKIIPDPEQSLVSAPQFSLFDIVTMKTFKDRKVPIDIRDVKPYSLRKMVFFNGVSQNMYELEFGSELVPMADIVGVIEGEREQQFALPWTIVAHTSLTQEELDEYLDTDPKELYKKYLPALKKIFKEATA